MPRGDLRNDVRLDTEARVEVSVRAAEGHYLNLRVKCENLSDSGIQVIVPEPLEQQSFVTVRSSKLGIHASGSVRHCRRVARGYLVGIHLSSGTRPK
jgi:hypothetical protein